MTALADAKFAKLRGLGKTGAINDMTLAWLQDGGATSPQITDAWVEWLAIQGFTTGDRNTDWFAYLRSQTHTGALNDMELQFWSAP